ncbi:hypothetical protein BDN71DRAFT_1452772 [Pleurotus eryngii]|uniref:Uncharacterized protein n=1 Tax=Pleurotus eryngii TaxID=5323 RepID=A0A9P5ZNI6_PLEER|nr:hypothetical protein BDN71DRAFT_1452772 [Pleurotus eryngii]
MPEAQATTRRPERGARYVAASTKGATSARPSHTTDLTYSPHPLTPPTLLLLLLTNSLTPRYQFHHALVSSPTHPKLASNSSTQALKLSSTSAQRSELNFNVQHIGIHMRVAGAFPNSLQDRTRRGHWRTAAGQTAGAGAALKVLVNNIGLPMDRSEFGGY